MVTQLTLRRFKKFKDTTVLLGPFTVMMGENSSGKTTVLQAANLALQALHRLGLVTTDATGAPKIRKKGVGVARPNLAGVSLSDYRELYYAKVSRGGAVLGAGGAELEMIDSRGDIYRLQITSVFGDSFNIKCTSTDKDIKQHATLHQKPPLFISGFVGLRAAEERAFPVAITDRLRSGNVSQIIRNLLLDTQENTPDRFKQLSDRMRADFSFHLEKLSFDLKKDLHVVAHYKNAIDDKAIYLDFNSSGSGFMQILQILAPIYRYCPDEADVVLLDEPDAHLHPNLQTDLARTLRSIQKELGIQIIISTHSTSIIRSAQAHEVVPIAAGPLCKPLSSNSEVETSIVNSLDSYSLGKSVISGKLVFIEDQRLHILEKMDQVLNIRSLTGPNTVPVIPGRGKDDKVPFQIRDVLKQYLDKDVEIHFIRDRDGIPPELAEHVRKLAERKSIKVHQLPRFEIENYLLNADLISRALAKKHPGKPVPSQTDIEAKITAVLTDTIRSGLYRYEQELADCIYKTGLVAGLEEYRNYANATSAAAQTYRAYFKLGDLPTLLTIGMGKEALKALFHWLCDEVKTQLSQQDILEVLEAKDVPKEIAEILLSIRSQQWPEDVSKKELAQPEEEDDGQMPIEFVAAAEPPKAMPAAPRAPQSAGPEKVQ